MRISVVLLLALLAGCTKTDIESLRGDRDGFLVSATASCAGLCAPERTDIYQAMHRHCAWPAVPAIQYRGTEPNGLLGTPHARWRFTCLTVGPDTEIPRDVLPTSSPQHGIRTGR